MLRRVAGWMAADLPGGEDEVRAQIDPRLEDVLADPAPAPAAATTIVVPARYTARGTPLDVVLTALRVRAPDGTVAGTAFVAKPAAGMAVLGTLTALGRHGPRRADRHGRADRGQRPRRRDERGCADRGLRERRAVAGLKALVERLDPDDALALGLQPDRLSCTALADLRTATDKARRDAPAIAVTEV